jgi:hypothetical protein
LFIPITNRFNIFKMLVYGAMISALSLAPMAAPWQWYGIGIIDAHYLMAILCMILLTIGEVVWSPKLNEYTAAIAPKGQEGTYLGMSLIPWFLAKTFVSLLSGHMLERWSPETVSVARQTLQSAGITPTVLADNLGARELARLAPQLGVDFSNQFAKLEPNAVAAQAQNLGFQVKTIANGAAYDSVIEQLKALKVPMVDFFTTTAQTVMLQVKQLGIDVFDLTQKIEAATLALKLKIVGVDVAKAVLQPGVNPAVTKVDVNFQLVLQRGWVDYWHSPGAMWLLLGAIAMGGCVVAAMLGGWLTEGARWKIEEHK